jgi:DNA-binding NarL/FixJ family response regulator
VDKLVQTDGGPVLLTGFDPLTTDVLNRFLTRHGFDTEAPSGPGPQDPAVLVLSVDAVTISRLDDVRQAWPTAPLVAVAHVSGGSVRQAARRVGAAAVVTRSAGVDAFVHAIRVAVDGGTLDTDEHEAVAPLAGLTERETAVLGLVAQGASNADIGEALGISPHTARTHVQNVMAKLGVRNRLAASAIARDAGLYPREAP